MSSIKKIPTFCGRDCGSNACPLLAVLSDGVVIRMERNKKGNGIKPCPRGYRLHEEYYSNDRILFPLIRKKEYTKDNTGFSAFREASWEEALCLISNKFSEIIAKYGNSAFLNMGGGGGNGCLHDSQSLTTRFFDSIGGAINLKGNYSNNAASSVLPYMFGDQYKNSGWDGRTARYSKLIVLWGANIIEARLGAELSLEIARAAKRGTKIIVIDPRKTMTAQVLGAEWIPILPGTDAALMLSVLYVLFSEGYVDFDKCNSISFGMDKLYNYVIGTSSGIKHNPEWAEKICGIPKEKIYYFARLYGQTKPCMLVPGYSIQRVFNGADVYRLSVAMQVASGNIGVLGGSSGSLNNRLPHPKIDLISTTVNRKNTQKFPTVPILRWADFVIDNAKTKAAFVAGFNAVNQGADCKKSVLAMQSIEFSVCSELYFTKTASLCDVILPTNTAIERSDICVPWQGNFLLYKDAVVKRRGLCRSDYDIFCELSSKMSDDSLFSEGKSEKDWIQYFLDSSEVNDKEKFIKDGIYFAKENERTGLSSFCKDPEKHKLSTKSGKIEICSQEYAADTNASDIPQWNEKIKSCLNGATKECGTFFLITPKSINRIHSQGGNPNFQKRNQAYSCDLGEATISKNDALRLGIKPGDELCIWNENGKICASAKVSDCIMPSVICVHEGAWFFSETKDNASVNMLSSTLGTIPFSSAVMHGIPVFVHKIE